MDALAVKREFGFANSEFSLPPSRQVRWKPCSGQQRKPCHCSAHGAIPATNPSNDARATMMQLVPRMGAAPTAKLYVNNNWSSTTILRDHINQRREKEEKKNQQ